MNHHPSLIRLSSLLLVVALLLGLVLSNLPRPAEASPQSNASQTNLSTPQLLNQALAKGEITAEQRLLYLT
jgi:hypothetical protein